MITVRIFKNGRRIRSRKTRLSREFDSNKKTVPEISYNNNKKNQIPMNYIYNLSYYLVYSSITTTFVSFFLFAKLDIALISLLPPVFVMAFFFFLFSTETGRVFTKSKKNYKNNINKILICSHSRKFFHAKILKW